MAKTLVTDRQAFFDLAIREGLYSTRGNLDYHLQRLFAGVALAGRAFLDVGAGHGLHSLYAAVAGAQPVVALEPAAAGGRRDAGRYLGDHARALGVEIEVIQQPFQEYTSNHSFDVILLNNSINHLNEEATVRLLESEAAWQDYRQIARKLYTLTTPGGDVLITDCAGRNLFSDLGFANPFLPTIEWHKHHQPRIWIRLFSEAGFDTAETHWDSFNSLRHVGRLLGNRIAAYLLTSHFRVRLRKV